MVFNGASSETSAVTSGVPQGSILGPLLFLIYIDHISHVNLSPGSKLVLYGDDILLYRPISDYQMLQADIDSLSTWSTLNTMTFNTSKCKTIWEEVSSSPTHTPLSQWNHPWSVPTFKYLGVLLSTDLSWSSHIQGVCNKARKILGLLYRCYYQYSDSRTLCKLYLSLVRPHLDYAAQNWDPYLQCDINSLESVQRFALKVCSKKWDAGYNELLDMFRLPSLQNRHLHQTLLPVQNCSWTGLLPPWCCGAKH